MNVKLGTTSGLVEYEFYLNKFNYLKNKWKLETNLLSNFNRIITHPSYQEIINYGDVFLVFILKDLKQNGGLWFYALEKITEEKVLSHITNPTYNQLKDAWLQWGVNNKYIDK